MTTIRRLIAVVTAVCALAAHAADEQAAADDVTFSEAETRMWLTDQLRSIGGPVELVYNFEKSGSLEQGFSDEVKFTIEKVNDDGTKAASLSFFTGERNFPVPPEENTTVNPVLKVYLQGDVYEMNRLTDPNGTARERWRYFQRRIKFALAESASVSPVTFEFDGRQWHGYEIKFQPFLNDPKRNLFEDLAGKQYTVILADELPGYLYQIQTVVPAKDANAEPLIKETLKLEAVKPAAAP